VQYQYLQPEAAGGSPAHDPMSNPATGSTSTPAPLTYYQRVDAILGKRYRLEKMIAVSRERVLFSAWDEVLKRRVSLRVNFYSDEHTRSWFLREAESLAHLDHPAIRHVYDAAVIGDMAYRVGNWIDGESLHEAVQRGPRPLPTVHTLARDVLGALEHAHAHGIILRRIVPASLLLSIADRGTVTDLRYCNWTVPLLPPTEVPTGLAFMAPEIRAGEPGDPASDNYTAGAILYYAVTGQEPPLDTSNIKPASELRPNCPRTMERIIMRSLLPNAEDRFQTASEMLEDFASEAGTFENPAVSISASTSPGEGLDGARWEKRLRRALGDDYELLGMMGTGGFGRVYRVRDLHLEREVALKVLHPLLTTDPAVVERFRREAQLAARINHPNIVNIYDIGGRSGLIWYTMELVQGPSLAKLVEEQGPLPVDRVVRLLREALPALAQAHALGLVHRDIKPENMLTEPDGSLRITDFGLALALRGQGKFGGATSQSGTPQYASPEQLLGERVDQRSDLYSMAAVAYFALLGQSPFPGLTLEQVLARQTTNGYPELRHFRPDVSEDLQAALERALQSVVDQRYPSAIEFLQAVNRATGRGLRRRSGEWAKAALKWLKVEGKD
jgi:serine/threonine protein kinase